MRCDFFIISRSDAPSPREPQRLGVLGFLVH